MSSRNKPPEDRISDYIWIYLFVFLFALLQYAGVVWLALYLSGLEFKDLTTLYIVLLLSPVILIAISSLMLFGKSWHIREIKQAKRRRSKLKNHVRRMLKQKGNQFEINAVLSDFYASNESGEPVNPGSSLLENTEINKDFVFVRESIITDLLRPLWDAKKTTESQQGTVRWVAQRLRMSLSEVSTISCRLGEKIILKIFSECLSDPSLFASKWRELTQLAEDLFVADKDLRSLLKTEPTRKILRDLFLNFTVLSRSHESLPDQWRFLFSVGEKVGFSREELNSFLNPYKRDFIERLIANSLSNIANCEANINTLHWVDDNLELISQDEQYLQEKLVLLEELIEIEEGKMPMASAPEGIELNRAEITYFCSNANLNLNKNLKYGTKVETYNGMLVLTDSRIIFVSPSKSLEANYRSVLSHSESDCSITLALNGRSEMNFEFDDDSPIAYAIFKSAVAMANRTKSRSSSNKRSRHIPDDVKTRVWQNCGGRCVECGSQEYLEFDHIIPHSKGGSNAEANLQILCRNCNLKKSDHI